MHKAYQAKRVGKLTSSPIATLSAVFAYKVVVLQPLTTIGISSL